LIYEWKSRNAQIRNEEAGETSKQGADAGEQRTASTSGTSDEGIFFFAEYPSGKKSKQQKGKR
jgi:hypothetical protein